MIRAVVIGSGYAGEGHVRALQHAGVEVVAMCGREMSVVRAMADKVGVKLASTDWRQTLEELRPELVTLAVPAALRREVVELAAKLGCHVLCEKPLATTAREAVALCQIVERAGVKHAYAATRRYDPSVVWLAELVAGGAIGSVRLGSLSTHAGLTPPLPYSWVLKLDQGGGLLNNHFPHLLSVLEHVLGRNATSATGQATFGIPRAPVLPNLHDFREMDARIDALTPEELENFEWRETDADTAYRAELFFGDVSVRLASGPGVVPEGANPGMGLIGERGRLEARGDASFEVSLFQDGVETKLPVPQRLLDALPNLGTGVENRWAALARDFVADLRGEPHAPYLTFSDGARYQRIAESIRGVY